MFLNLDVQGNCSVSYWAVLLSSSCFSACPHSSPGRHRGSNPAHRGTWQDSPVLRPRFPHDRNDRGSQLRTDRRLPSATAAAPNRRGPAEPDTTRKHREQPTDRMRKNKQKVPFERDDGRQCLLTSARITPINPQSPGLQRSTCPSSRKRFILCSPRDKRHGARGPVAGALAL